MQIPTTTLSDQIEDLTGFLIISTDNEAPSHSQMWKNLHNISIFLLEIIVSKE